MRFFVGGYTADKGGEATGIGAVRAGGADNVLAGGPLSFAAALDVEGSPSWLAWHPTRPVLYAALEGTGTVRAFARTADERFTPFGPPVPAGASVCHLSVAPSGGALIASCYDGGRVVKFALDDRGGLGPATIGAAATDAYGTDTVEDGPVEVSPSASQGSSAFDSLVALLEAAAEPETPASTPAPGARVSHAHQTRFTPAGLVSTDLGFDQVRVWDARMRERQRVVLPRGTGPRHTLWHPSGHLYVVTEHSNEVFVLRPGADGVWALVTGAPLVGARPGIDFAAEIAASGDGRYVYVGLRGSNTISTLRVHGDGADLRSVAQTDAGVDWPRHHTIERDTLLVAGQLSHEVVSLGLDERTGVPGRVRHRVTAPSPTHLLADRR